MTPHPTPTVGPATSGESICQPASALAAPPAAAPDGTQPPADPAEGPAGADERAGGARAEPPAGPAGRRRGVADPVRAVMHRHRATIAGAVDAWEIAAGLEAHGVADADARRLRHRDVFGLAEELDARAPRHETAAGPAPVAAPARFAPWAAALHLLPGAVCAAAYPLPADAGTALALLTASAVLRRGPLRARGAVAAAVAACALLAFAALPAAQATALALSLAPAAYAAQLFAAGARRRLGASRTLSAMARGVRPRLAAALAGYALALAALLYPAGLPAAPVTLGVLLFTARLLAVHGRQRSAAAVLGAAAVAEGLVRCAAALGGGPFPAAGTATTAVCVAAATAAAVRAFRMLPRASAHRPG